MTRKLILIGIVLIGFVLALGSNAWAGNGQRGKRYKNDRSYHQGYKAPPGHHYGWEKGKKNPHKRHHRHYRTYRNRDHHQRPVVVEKHVYHDYQAEEPVEENDGVKFAFSVADAVFGISVEVNEAY